MPGEEARLHRASQTRRAEVRRTLCEHERHPARDPQTKTAQAAAAPRAAPTRASTGACLPSYASTSRPDAETEDDTDVEMETSRTQDQDADVNVQPPHHPSHIHDGLASDTFDVDLDAHITNANAADDGVSHGIVALDQNVNDYLEAGAPSGAPGVIDATPRTRTNTLILNTRNTTREHYRHHGHAHNREELMPLPVVMSDSADGATAGPARTSPARSAAAWSNLESPVQATRGALLFFSPSLFVVALDVHRQPSTDSPATSLTPSNHSLHVRVSRPCSACDGSPLGLNHHIDSDDDSDEEPACAAHHRQVGHLAVTPTASPPVVASPPALRRTSSTLARRGPVHVGLDFTHARARSPANACRDAHHCRQRERGSGVGQGQNAECDGDSTEGGVASRRLARVRERQQLALAAAAALAGVQPVPRFSVARNNGTTTASKTDFEQAGTVMLALRHAIVRSSSSSRRAITINDNTVPSESCGSTPNSAYTRAASPPAKPGGRRVGSGGAGAAGSNPGAGGARSSGACAHIPVVCDASNIGYDPNDAEACSLHLHSVTSPHNFGRIFSSPAPGLVLAVDSVRSYLNLYEECDTFLSTDAGLHWTMVSKDANKYEFGDQGSIMVLVNDEDGVDEVRYSSDLGRTWKSLKLQYRIRARALTTVPDSTSQKFMLVGQLARKDQTGSGRFVVIFLDFASTRSRQCTDNDFEKWYARSGDKHECIMGHKQWYRRRKPDADCYVGHKFDDPVEHEENCPCTNENYERIPGSSGYRLIPGNTCDKSRGIVKDAKVQKDCSLAQPGEGEVTHQTFEFASEIVQYAYFKESTTILVRLHDGTVWQSSNEGYTWIQLFPNERFIVFYLCSYSNDRAYILTSSQKYYYTTDVGRSWNPLYAPLLPNTFGAVIMHFHPISDYLIWTGNADCEGSAEKCRAEARYSTDNGRNWRFVEEYVRNCAWARDAELKIDATQTICESYKEKKGNQRLFQANTNPLQLVGGTQFFSKKKVLFDRVVGFAKFSEFLIVAEYLQERQSLDLQVSLDGKNFATGVFPPTLRPQNHAYTILESSTKSVFMHLTMSEFPSPYWGVIMKSNGNGTYFGISADNVNRNDRGFVDFEKMIGLDGIALINVVTNTENAAITRRKELSSRITHNDGGSWKPITPPKTDALGQPYACTSTACSLQIHGYTERFDTRATYSSPSVPGLLMAVGNVSETLAPYTECDTFLSRDAGFSWQEIHKDEHLWEFGDSGLILVIANDEEPTDHVLFSTDEGITWRETRVDGSYFWATTGGGAGAAGRNPGAGGARSSGACTHVTVAFVARCFGCGFEFGRRCE
ncbi:hypothetical protein DFH11DRAFT_1733918 [Phellopilus nigrolimitatus]|nr:hypothetical protein DFH11DRAFT_1733918 [Phellopilus nigrolimitatus]